MTNSNLLRGFCIFLGLFPTTGWCGSRGVSYRTPKLAHMDQNLIAS
jgi:hypothetical protein